MADQDALHVTTTLFGSINGVIGVVASLPQPLFEWFKRLEVRCCWFLQLFWWLFLAEFVGMFLRQFLHRFLWLCLWQFLDQFL